MALHHRNHCHGNQILLMDQYAVCSQMASWNPDWKIMLGLISLLGCIGSKTGLISVAVGLCMAVLTHKWGGVEWPVYGRMLTIPLFFVILSGAVIALDFTKEAVMEAVFVTVKVLTGTACLYMISLTTPVYEVVGTLRRWHLPEVMLELMILMYRFLFGLLELYEQMKQSAQARLGDIWIRQGYRSFFGICANLLVLAFRRASDSFNAMEARRYDGELRFLEEKKLVTGRQRLGIVLYGVLLAAGLLAERMWSI